MRVMTFAIVLALGGAPQCAPTHPDAVGGRLTGDWGAPHAQLTLTDSSGAITYDCARGEIPGGLVADADGRFDVAGIHVRGHGGPVRENEVPDALPARYIGRVKGDRMTLRVVAGADTLGPYELQRGAVAQLVRCL